MIASLLLMLAVSPMKEPEAPCQYCAAIFDDVRLNAMIGNGNVEVSNEWAAGGDGDDVSIKIEEINCNDGRARRKCSFTLRRVLTRNGIAATDPSLPERLQCTATLKRLDDRWGVEHSTPRRVGHSRTSMKCQRIESAA